MLDGQRAAIVLLSAIGDIVHALPLVSSLKAAAPGLSIEWVTQPVAGEIAGRHPAVDRLWTLDRGRGWRGFRDLRRALRGQRFDLVVDLQVYAKASLVTAMLDSPRKLGFDRPRARELNWLVTNERLAPGPPRQACEQYLEFADHLGAPRRYEWPLPLSPEERTAQAAFYAGLRSPLAALVVGTSRPAKEWPVDRWARFAESLHADFGYQVCIVGSDRPGERARALEIARLSRSPILDERRDDLRRLIWLLDGAALVVSPDTGPYHLAVALGVPSIGLYGYTDPARVGPGRRFTELVVDAFHDPGEAWHPPRTGYRGARMERIETGRVIEAVELARARYPRAVGRSPNPSDLTDDAGLPEGGGSSAP
ncbi:MAG TPA: glycosyltransferase family 9 protein [Gemmatimonadota bacterium]|nr:glycosyltransferase family 9 protein [Gemmatimonadota bacterium]